MIFPQVLAEWCWGHNGHLDPYCTAPYSHQIVCWICPLGHHAPTPIDRRISQNLGCSICANRILLAGYNDLATVRPELIPEWDFEANGDVTPDSIFPGSPFKAHWICPSGHRYMAKVNNRAAGQRSGCGVCSNKVIVTGVNDLLSRAPSYMTEWDWEQNEVDPSTLSVRSSYRAHWVCGRGHRWRTRVMKRAQGQGCPYCMNSRLLPGFNDLLTVNPVLAAEWDYERNELPPSQYLARSSKKAWWLCSSGHSWSATLDGRSAGRGCERCQKRATSLIEQEFYAAFADSPLITDPHGGTFSLPIHWRTRTYMRVDMSGKHSTVGNIAIEYDGSYYHRSSTQVARDVDKTKALLEAGYFVVRIRENDLPHLPMESPRLLHVNHLYGQGDPASAMHEVLRQLRDCPLGGNGSFPGGDSG